MSDRSTAIRRFLAQGSCGGWHQTPLAGDASTRRYLRLQSGTGQSVILMDADPATGQDLTPFLRIAAHLADIGLCPPAILQQDTAAGLLVISDLGPSHIADWLATHPQETATLYTAAVDVLGVVAQHAAPSGLAIIDAAQAGAMLAPLFDHYVDGCPDAAGITGALREVWRQSAPHSATLALRDYHAENLIWRGDRNGTDRIGLLDFQDAVLAPPEYDLVSLLRDARRDTAPALRTQLTQQFCAMTERDKDQVSAAMACIGVQRNLRIMGIFARLAAQQGKSRYLDLLPRVWTHVTEDLQHPALAPLQHLVLKSIPAPEAPVLQRLRHA